MYDNGQEEAVTRSSVLKQSRYVYLALGYLSYFSCPSPTQTWGCLQCPCSAQDLGHAGHPICRLTENKVGEFRLKVPETCSWCSREVLLL